jgi:hypothetical protein
MDDPVVDYVARHQAAISTTVDLASGLTMMAVAILAYVTVRGQGRGVAWFCFLLYGVLAGSSTLLAGAAGVIPNVLSRAAPALHEASLLFLLLMALWLPPLSSARVDRASRSLKRWTLLILGGAGIWMLTLVLHPSLLNAADTTARLDSQQVAFTTLTMATAAFLVLFKFKQHKPTGEVREALIWAFIPLAFFPSLQAAALLHWHHATQLPYWSPVHVLNLVATWSLLFVTVSIFAIFFLMQQRSTTYYQWGQSLFFCISMAVCMVIALTSSPELFPILAGLARLGFILGLAFALTAAPTRRRTRGWQPYATSFGIALVAAAPALIVFHGISRIWWTLGVAVLVGASILLLHRWRQSLRQISPSNTSKQTEAA